MAATDFTPDQRATFQALARERADREAERAHPPGQPQKRREWADRQATRYYRQCIGEDQ